MEITIKIKNELGQELEIVRTISDISPLMNMSDIGNLVKNFGSSVLPEMEGKLVNQVSGTYDIGEKNKAEWES